MNKISNRDLFRLAYSIYRSLGQSRYDQRIFDEFLRATCPVDVVRAIDIATSDSSDPLLHSVYWRKYGPPF